METLERVDPESLLLRDTNLDLALMEEASRLLEYGGMPSEAKPETAVLCEALKELDIRPFNPVQVRQYMDAKVEEREALHSPLPMPLRRSTEDMARESWNAQRESEAAARAAWKLNNPGSDTNRALHENLVVVGIVVCLSNIALSVAASPAFAFIAFAGFLVTCFSVSKTVKYVPPDVRGNYVARVDGGQSYSEIAEDLMIWEADERASRFMYETKARWKRFSINAYDSPIPEYVLQTAIDLRKKCGEWLELAIFDLIEEHRSLDPFLAVKIPGKNEWLYIEVWDEPKFKASRSEVDSFFEQKGI